MAVGRDRVDRVVDLFVFAPLGLAIVARDSIPAVARSVRRRLLRSANAAPAVAVTEIPAVRPNAPAHVPTDVPTEPAVSADELPIVGYDHLAARQIVDRLAVLSDGERSLVAAYEQAHRCRQTVLGKISQLDT